MLGGHEKPCRSPAWLAKFQSETQQRCPYVPLGGDLTIAASLCQYSLSEHLRPLAGEAFRLLTDGLTLEERQEIIVAIRDALSDKRVVDRLYPWNSDAEKAKRKR